MPMNQTGVTPNAGIKRMKRASGQIEEANDGFTKLSMLIQFRVLDWAPPTPPADPEEGDSYLLDDAAVGYGDGGQNDVVFWSNGWQVLAPQDGWRLRILAEDVDMIYDAGNIEWTEDDREGSVDDNLTADDSQSQGTGELTAVLSRFTTVGTDGDCATLPTPRPGRKRWVVNDGAEDMAVFPQATHYIDTLAQDATRTVAAGKRCLFVAVSSTRWVSFLSA